MIDNKQDPSHSLEEHQVVIADHSLANSNETSALLKSGDELENAFYEPENDKD